MLACRDRVVRGGGDLFVTSRCSLSVSSSLTLSRSAAASVAYPSRSCAAAAASSRAAAALRSSCSTRSLAAASSPLSRSRSVAAASASASVAAAASPLSQPWGPARVSSRRRPCSTRLGLEPQIGAHEGLQPGARLLGLHLGLLHRLLQRGAPRAHPRDLRARRLRLRLRLRPERLCPRRALPRLARHRRLALRPQQLRLPRLRRLGRGRDARGDRSPQRLRLRARALGRRPRL